MPRGAGLVLAQRAGLSFRNLRKIANGTKSCEREVSASLGGRVGVLGLGSAGVKALEWGGRKNATGKRKGLKPAVFGMESSRLKQLTWGGKAGRNYFVMSQIREGKHQRANGGTFRV